MQKLKLGKRGKCAENARRMSTEKKRTRKKEKITQEKKPNKCDARNKCAENARSTEKKKKRTRQDQTRKHTEGKKRKKTIKCAENARKRSTAQTTPPCCSPKTLFR